MKLEYVAWDSSFFSMKIGKIECMANVCCGKLKKLLENSISANYSLLYVFTPGNEFLGSDLLTCYNGLLVDRKRTYELNIKNNRSRTNGTIVSCDFKIAPSEMLELAYSSGRYSRFFIDNHFSRELFEQLYKTWIAKSLTKEIADEVFVSMLDVKISAFVTVKKRMKSGEIGLLAVAKEEQRSGLGTKLLDACVRYLHKSSIDNLVVSTQSDNVNACKFYEKYGFTPVSIVNVYHFWL